MNNKKQAKHKVSNVRFRVLLCVIMAAVLFAGCSASEQEVIVETGDDVYAYDLYTEPPALPPVEVVMDDYSFTYAGERASVILTEETENGLEFFAELKNEKAPIFTLVYNSQEGDIVSVLAAESGEQTPVSFMMFEMPGGLSEEDEQSFLLAQEAVNEIVASIKLK